MAFSFSPVKENIILRVIHDELYLCQLNSCIAEMILVYTPELSPRIEYTLRVIFQEVLGVIYRATNDLNVFIGSKDLKLAYSDFPVRDCLCIRQNSLLCETGIERQKITTGMWDELPAIFMQESSPVPFDLFSAVFYLVSRYEEYLPFNSDQHNRFPAEKSLAFGSDFLRIPVVDLWCKKLAGLLGIEADCRNNLLVV